MKKVCFKHQQAYEDDLGCLYCTPAEEVTKVAAKNFPTSHAPGPVGCMDYLIEDKDLDTYGYYTFSNAFPIRDLHIKTTKKVTILGDIQCLGGLYFNEDLSIIGLLQVKKSIQGLAKQGSVNLEVKGELIVGGMVSIGGNIKTDLDLSVYGDLIAEDVESLMAPIYCGGNITCDNIYSFSSIEAYGNLNVDNNIHAQGTIYCHQKIKGNIISGSLYEVP